MKENMENDPLYEVIFDIASNLSVHLNQLSDAERDALMDAVEGSRGLCFDHVIPWAKEFQNKWTDREDYLIAIDRFVSNKVADLRKLPKRAVSIQVVPTVQRADEVGAQFEGPDEHTTHWSVYERGADGLANWIADFGCKGEHLAMRFATIHATALGVPIEPQPWKARKQAEIVTKEVAPAELFHVEWTTHVDIDAATARDAALMAREFQCSGACVPTVFGVRDDFGGPTQRITLLEVSDDKQEKQ